MTELRRHATAFAHAAGASAEVIEAITLAVSETVTNAILHAFDRDGGQVRLSCWVDGERVVVEVADEGRGIASRPDSPGIGHGLALVGALAQTLEFAPGPDGRGTSVTMTFGAAQPLQSPPGLEMLCALALETIADVSCVDLVHDGVLRRAAAQVANDHALTAWLRAALPPAKPGTATWAVLREGGTHLVVHDPSVPRSPGGTGDRLDLIWWVTVALDHADGSPSALWGLGGRRGGRSVPSPDVVRLLGHAAQGDLTNAADRAFLRARLATAPGS